MMKIAIRTDSSLQIGIGHLMRCLTLAEALRDRGDEIHFICRDLPGNSIELVQQRGFEVTQLPYSDLYNNWLGEELTVEIIQTQEALVAKVDWLIVDHYALGAEWETAMRNFSMKIMVIDDLADKEHECDLLLNQNLYRNLEERYNRLVQAHCVKLLGPRYALLRNEFLVARKHLVRESGPVKRILIFFGGSDSANMTELALKAVLMVDDKLEVDVVVGGQNPHRERVEDYCAELPNVHYYCQVENMAELMSRADLAVGAAGVSSWERCCLGLPAIVISIADNQVANAEILLEQGVAIYLGESILVAADNIVESVVNLVSRPQDLVQMSTKAMGLVDGKGVGIVMEQVR